MHETHLSENSILLFGGIFLQRPELRMYWDYSVYLRVEWDRNHHIRKRWNSGRATADPRNERYREGQRIYHEECNPVDRADLVIDNHDPVAPYVVR